MNENNRNEYMKEYMLVKRDEERVKRLVWLLTNLNDSLKPIRAMLKNIKRTSENPDYSKNRRILLRAKNVFDKIELEFKNL